MKSGGRDLLIPYVPSHYSLITQEKLCKAIKKIQTSDNSQCSGELNELVYINVVKRIKGKMKSQIIIF